MLVLAALLPMLGGHRPAAAQTSTTAPPPIPPPAAAIVVDAATGAVLLASNEHVRRPPASISKLMTALVTREELTDDSPIHVSAAAAAMPARKLSILAGQTWKESDLLRAMLLCSCNDVARALAENAGGSVGGFGKLARAEAARLGTVDAPVLQDPAGLDDEDSVGGGNRISAYDMAILARAFLADPTLAAIVRKPEHRWLGPDGVVHEVQNHNRLLGTYPGAIGVKTGYTKRAQATLVAAATRDGRTIIAVILGSQSIWYHAPQLLDFGFRTPVTATMERLPGVPGEVTPPTTAPPTTQPAVTTPTTALVPTLPPTSVAAPATGRSAASSPSALPAVLGVVGAVVAVLGLLVALRRRQVVRRRARARARARNAALDALVADPRH